MSLHLRSCTANVSGSMFISNNVHETGARRMKTQPNEVGVKSPRSGYKQSFNKCYIEFKKYKHCPMSNPIAISY